MSFSETFVDCFGSIRIAGIDGVADFERRENQTGHPRRAEQFCFKDIGTSAGRKKFGRGQRWAGVTQW